MHSAPEDKPQNHFTVICMHCVACYARSNLQIHKKKYKISSKLHAELQIAWEYIPRLLKFKKVRRTLPPSHIQMGQICKYTRKSTQSHQNCMQSCRLHGNIFPDSRTLWKCEPVCTIIDKFFPLYNFFSLVNFFPPAFWPAVAHFHKVRESGNIFPCNLQLCMQF